MEQDHIVTSEIWGKPVRFSIGDASDLIQSVQASGQFYEPEELDIIRQYCRFGSVFVDIGANVGNHSLFAALFLRTAKVIPFEINPAAIGIYEKNIKINELEGVVDTQHLGIGLAGQDADNVALDVPAGNLGGARVSEKSGAFKLRRGDDLLAGQQVDFIKIDVEGLEISVLSGLQDTIRRCQPRIFVEVHQANLDRFHAWLEDSGYLIADRFQRYVANENFMLLSKQDATFKERAEMAAKVTKKRAKRELQRQERRARASATTKDT